MKYEANGDINERDPRTSSLKFMYSVPNNKTKEDQEEEEEVEGKKIPSQYLDIGQEDEMVLAFKSKLEGKIMKQSQQNVRDPEVEIEPGPKVDPPLRSLHQSKSSYNPSVPQVQCARCGDWGHLAGEAACPMKNDNPHDWARQQKEDPMTFMKKGILEHKQKLILRHASIPSELRNHELLVDQLVHSDDEEIEDQDLETKFLSTLTTDEKRHLLVHLENMEATGEDIALYSPQAYRSLTENLMESSDSDNSDNDSSSSSSDESNSSSRSDRSHQRHREKKRKKSSSGSSKEKKKKSKKEKKGRREEHKKTKKRDRDRH